MIEKTSSYIVTNSVMQTGSIISGTHQTKPRDVTG